jgi:PAS domain S-box-containing protein
MRSRRPRILPPALLAGLVAITVVVIVTLIVALTSLRDVYLATEAVAHTYSVKARLDQLLSTLVDAETGERGFIITGDEAYLEPYTGAVASIAPRLSSIRSLTADNRDQPADADQLATLTTARLRELAAAIHQRREVGLAAAQAIVRTNVGKRTMDAARLVVQRMEAREDALLIARTARATDSYRRASVERIVTAVMALAAIGGLFVVTRRLGVERWLAQAAAERLRVTFSSIGDAVLVTDDAGRVTQMNPIAEGMTGWTASRAVGRRIEDVFVIIHEESRRPEENPVPTVLREGVLVGLANHTLLIAKDGREIPVDDSAAPIKTTDGHVIGAIVVFRDVTERRRAERERTTLIDDLSKAVHVREDFLAIASHELRNPVNTIQFQLVGLLRWLDRSPEALPLGAIRERLGRTVDQVKHLVRLLDNLLDVSRIRSGPLNLDLKDVDLVEVLKSMVERFSNGTEQGQITFHASSESFVGRWDRLRLEQVTANLLSNAVKYGTGKPIEVTLRGDGNAALLSVTDLGIGIAPEEQARLFGRFERAVSGEQYGGFGLGLWISRQIVETMGGSISVKSAPGQGSTFIVALPLGGAS